MALMQIPTAQSLFDRNRGQVTPLGQIPMTTGQGILGRPVVPAGQLPATTGRAATSQLLSQPTRPGFLGRIGRAATGLGRSLSDPNMLLGIGSGLLTGPQRVPVDFGQSLAQGLLMGRQLKRQELEDLLTRAKIQGELADASTAIGGRPQDIVAYQYVLDEEGNPRATFFDKRIRKTVFSDTGEAVDEQLIPISQGELPNTKFMKETREELVTEEQAFDSMDKYLLGLAQDPKGMSRYFNKVQASLKSAFGGRAPTREELATAINEGRLQGLIGQVREEVVGPGVMTEFDAVRILMSLGGDYSIFQSPEAAIQLIGEVKERKYNAYQEQLGEFNRAYETLPSGSALKRVYKQREGYKLNILPNREWFENKATLEQWNKLSDEEKRQFNRGI